MSALAGRRIIFVNRFFHPDHSATAQILSDLARHLAGRGCDVRVVASRMLYEDSSARLPAFEVWEGVRIHRVRTTAFGRAGLAGRAADYASFYPAAFSALLKIARKGDVVVAKTDPPLLSVAMAPAARMKGARLVNWLQDLYPEVAAELGVAAMAGPAGSLLRGLRNASLRGAALNVAIGERMAERLRAEGAAPERVAVIHNWSDDEAIAPMEAAASPLRAEWGFTPGDFVVGYSGNLGRAHEVGTLLAAARGLRARADIKFLFVGGGHHSGPLGRRAAEEGLTNIVFRPYQPRERLAQSLAAADVHWVSLNPPLEGLIVPSKFYGAAAAGRPVIAVTSADGEIARLVRDHDCGAQIDPGDGEALARVILELAADPAGRARMGEAARRMIDQTFARRLAMENWRAALERAASG